jgi:thiol-disulfide isomerase/thioredoxin
MGKKIFISLFLVLSFSICFGQKKSIICGTYTQSDKITIEICEPISGFFNNGYISSELNSYIKANDSFYLKTNVQKSAAFYSITINLKENGERVRLMNFLIVPGDSIHIKIDPSIDNYTCIKFDGSNAKGNELYAQYSYQTFDKYTRIDSLVKKLQNNEEIFLNQFDLIYKSQIAPFQSALGNREITQEYFNMMRISVKMHLIDFCSSKLLRDGLLANKLNLDFRKNIVEKLYQKVKADSNYWKASDKAVRFYINYYNFKTISEKNIANTNLLNSNDIFINERDSLLKIDKLLVHLTYILPKKTKEILWFFYLFDIFSFAKGYFQNELIISQYSFIFPKSPYTDLLKKEFEKNKNPYKVVYTNSRPISFIDSTLHYKSLKEVFAANFKSKIIFVDLWASWCLPCISEFAFNAEVDSVLDKMKIEKLYVSFDNSKTDWVNSVEKFKLGGLHLLLNKDLLMDIKKIMQLPNDAPLGIPRYLILRNDGAVIDANAPRPSNPILKRMLEKL